ncbi:DUF92 domain-containing protein [Fictibacillus aquaticus]|uniref:DUF92 domain-containing protein n=1 Tax=Fictibacillus aquaticus TaxID=2021314 RepID=A0A235F9A8_9BACL|nr:DUF92 domain-containing protein [Fictibacillus aquaticus]OYD57842.1 hypothetical protein CGZ90_08035 [Fictibacillus aquaticus]
MAVFAAGAAIALFCFIVYRLKLLTAGGSSAAFVLGITAYAAFDWHALVLIGAFFASSVIWTKFGKRRKIASEVLRHESGGRTAGQVLANGGAGLAAAAVHLFMPSPVWLAAFAASFAEAAADTWASELGFLSKEKPYHLKLRKKVEPGLSGAVSWLGSTASAAGAICIAVAAFLLYNEISLAVAAIIAASAVAGCFADTIFGAWVEPACQCRRCGIQTESELHCGEKTVTTRGAVWMTNNMVNFLSSFFSACLAAALTALLL